MLVQTTTEPMPRLMSILRCSVDFQSLHLESVVGPPPYNVVSQWGWCLVPGSAPSDSVCVWAAAPEQSGLGQTVVVTELKVFDTRVIKVSGYCPVRNGKCVQEIPVAVRFYLRQKRLSLGTGAGGLAPCQRIYGEPEKFHSRLAGNCFV